MKHAVFGATGRIGEHVVQQSLGAGHHVTAVVRSQSRPALSHPNLEVARVATLRDTDSIWPALVGCDAALSGVGPRTRKDITVASDATRGIVAALREAGVPH